MDSTESPQRASGGPSGSGSPSPVRSQNKGGLEDIKVKAGNFHQENMGKLKDHYRIGKVLSAEENGVWEVRLVVHRESGTERRVKILKKSHMDPYEIRMFFNEISILKELDHPNIIKMYEFFEDSKRFYIVMDIMKGGELFDIIEESGPMSERDCSLLMKQVLACVNYCHNNNVIHRDLKPENILMEQNKGPD